MKIILTGITGNLGSEVFYSLQRNGHEIMPVVRAGSKEEAIKRLELIFGTRVSFPEIIISDLQKQSFLEPSVSPDCIIHCAGIVRFRDVQNRNVEMAKSVSNLADKLNVPLYHISTAFVWKPDNSGPRNEYEKDKIEAEKIITGLAIPWAIFRPSILTGNSDTGKILQFTGYHMVLKAFMKAFNGINNDIIRFPRFVGETNILPVNLAADTIINLVENNARGTYFITNPTPPSSEWLVSTSLKLLALDKQISFIDCSLGEYDKFNLSKPESELFDFLKHFAPYWTGSHIFPGSQVKSALVDSDYLKKIIGYAESKNWM